MYIKILNGISEKYSITQLRKDNPQVSFPATPSNVCLAEWNVFPLAITPTPIVDHTQVVSEVEPVQKDGKWVQTWLVRTATKSELFERTSDKANFIRAERQDLLASTDWTQVSDVSADQAAWANYRQKLRDITTQEGFPWSIIWPVAPV